MFWTATWRKTPGGCFWHYLCKTIYLRSRKVALLQYLLKCALHLSSWRLKCYYNQRNSVGTDRENVVPGNLIIIWKLNEAWPLKKNYYGHFLTALKAFKTKRELHHCLTTLKVFNSEKDAITVLKFLIPKKDFITCLGLLKFLTLRKSSITSLRLLKVLILKNDSVTFL